MTALKKIWSFYSVKLILALAITTALSVTLRIYALSGGFLLAASIYIFVSTFKDSLFKKKKLVLKILIYYFTAMLIIAGFLTMFQGADAGDTMRQQLYSSSAS